MSLPRWSMVVHGGAKAGGGGAFDPLSLAPAVWLDASTLALNDDDAVASWTDQSGNDADASQATAGNRPVYKTGQTPAAGPVVRFTAASSQYLSLDYDGEPTTFFLVCRKSGSVIDAHETWLSADTTDAVDLAAYYIKPKGAGTVGGGNIMELVRATDDNSGATANPAIGVWHDRWIVMAGTFDSTGATLYLNGQRVAFGANAGTRRPIQAATTLVGAGWFANAIVAHVSGDIAEMVIFDNVLTAGQIRQMNDFLADKHAITLPGVGPATLPTFVYPTFNGSTETFRLLYSSDGLTFTEARTELVPALGSVRDPSIFFWEGFYWIVYTLGSFSTSTSFGVAKSADWRGPYTWVANVDCSSISGVNRIWGPKHFIDPADDSLHIIFAASALGNDGPFFAFRVEPTDLTGLTTWGAPTQIEDVDDVYSDVIDCFIIEKGGTYYFWTKDESEVGSGGKYNVVLSSNSPFSGYTAFETGDWAGWGQDLYEGVHPIQIDETTWRVYMDNYGAGTGEHYSESTDDWATWTAPAAITAPTPVPRNGVILYTAP
jgi:hypothetical protein